jgi:ribosomal protein L11 methyltransferase
VLSGILENQAEDVALAYSQEFIMDPILIDGEWARVSGTKII